MIPFPNAFWFPALSPTLLNWHLHTLNGVLIYTVNGRCPSSAVLTFSLAALTPLPSGEGKRFSKMAIGDCIPRQPFPSAISVRSACAVIPLLRPRNGGDVRRRPLRSWVLKRGNSSVFPVFPSAGHHETRRIFPPRTKSLDNFSSGMKLYLSGSSLYLSLNSTLKLDMVISTVQVLDIQADWSCSLQFQTSPYWSFLVPYIPKRCLSPSLHLGCHSQWILILLNKYIKGKTNW